MLAYTGARAGTVAQLSGKDREIPVRHDLEAWLREYMAAAGIEEASRTSPLLCAAEGKRGTFTGDRFDAHSMRQMLNAD